MLFRRRGSAGGAAGLDAHAHREVARRVAFGAAPRAAIRQQAAGEQDDDDHPGRRQRQAHRREFEQRQRLHAAVAEQARAALASGDDAKQQAA